MYILLNVQYIHIQGVMSFQTLLRNAVLYKEFVVLWDCVPYS